MNPIDFSHLVSLFKTYVNLPKGTPIPGPKSLSTISTISAEQAIVGAMRTEMEALINECNNRSQYLSEVVGNI